MREGECDGAVEEEERTGMTWLYCERYQGSESPGVTSRAQVYTTTTSLQRSFHIYKCLN